MNEIKIPLDSKKSIKFFSKYHNADLYLNISGFFTIETVNPAMMRNAKKFINIIYPDLLSALQSALTLVSEKGDIHKMLADYKIFNTINTYMSICLENMEDIEFKGITAEKVCFDAESLTVIKIREQGKAFEEIKQHFLWTCSKCGCKNDSKFCKDCGTPKSTSWKCVCGSENTGKECTECGLEKHSIWNCSCGSLNKGKFCPMCGKPRDI